MPDKVENSTGVDGTGRRISRLEVDRIYSCLSRALGFLPRFGGG